MPSDSSRVAWLAASCSCCSPRAPAHAQYTANIQGMVEDPSAAGIASAKVDLVNLATQVVRDHDLGRVRATTGF